jgi:hypothetical protein
MGRSLAELHTGPRPDGLTGRTEVEVSGALEFLRAGQMPPAPFDRVRVETLEAMLANRPDMTTAVPTHGAPIVSAAVLSKSVVHFESAGTEGFDPPERDLSIVIRSIAETFTSEVAATFLEGYVERGGALPHGPTLDWYGVIAAFR